ncbi:glycosyltransferase family 1 protein [Nocardia terpenica]|nr:glycosyltransferase family 1 protein [Nocardia terpenica]
MKALLAFAGSRGDAQPAVLLARALLDRGHDVTLAVSPNLISFAEERGVHARSCGPDTYALLRDELAEPRKHSRNPVEHLRGIRDFHRRAFDEVANDLLELAPGVDVVVAGVANTEVAAAVAGHLGVPFAGVHYFPVRPNRSVPVLPSPLGDRVPGMVNYLAWYAALGLRKWALAPTLAELAHRAPAAWQPAPQIEIQAYDPLLIPGLSDEFGPDRPFVGFLTAAVGDQSARDPALDTWIAADRPPIYAGFGSMPVGDPAQLLELLRTVCRRQGERLLFVSGWSTVESEMDDQVAVVPQVDHATVLPRCAAAIHHGGAGTVAATVRAGLPSVVCPLFADQPYWGNQLRRLGIGANLPFDQLTAEGLGRLLGAVASGPMRRRVARIAADIRDDAVPRTADIIESLCAGAGRSHRPSGLEREEATWVPIRPSSSKD